MKSTQGELKKVLRARVAPEVKKRVVKLARERRTDESEVVRAAVAEFLEANETKEEV